MRGRHTYDIIVYPPGPPFPNFQFNNFFFKIMTHIINLILKKKKKIYIHTFLALLFPKLSPLDSLAVCIISRCLKKKERKKERKNLEKN